MPLKQTRNTIAFVSICIASAVFIALRFSEFIVGSVGDDAVYVEMARSIAQGRGPIIYLSEFATYFPFAFPAGYPFLLSPMAILFPDAIFPLKLVSLLLPLSAIPFYYICKHFQISRTLIMHSIAMVLLNPWIIAYSNRVLSEAAYTFFSYLALLSYVKWQEKIRPLSSIILLLAVLFTLGFSASIRTVGLALIGAALLHLLISGKWAHLASLSIGLAVVMLPQLSANRQSGGSIISQGYHMQVISHVQHFSTRLEFMTHNAIGYLDELPAALLPVFGNQIQTWANYMGIGGLYTVLLSTTGLLLLSLIAIGIWRLFYSAPQGLLVIFLYLTLYTGALLNFAGWPSGIQLRLLIPVLPFLYAFLLMGVSYFALRVKFAPLRAVHLVTVVILILSSAHNLYRANHSMSKSRTDLGRGFVDYSTGQDWIHAHTHPKQTIIARYPLERHIHFNRPLIGYPDHVDNLEVLALDERNISFLFISPGNPDYPDQLDPVELEMKEMAETHPRVFQLAYKNSDKNIYIYRVKQ